MNVRFVHLISGRKPGPWGGLATAPPGLLEDLTFLRERRGEKIVALDADSGAPLGWVGLYPDRDEGGIFFHRAGIEVHPAHRGMGIDSGLMEEAGRFIRTKKATRVKFGTSPLLTENAELYVTRFGARYRWREAIKTPGGRPWPCVACECDFDDPLARPIDLLDEEVSAKSVIDWEGNTPVPRKGVVYSGPLSVVLPDITSEDLTRAVDGVPRFLETMHSVFQQLFLHGYGFAWFDRLARGVSSEPGPSCYYVMAKVLAV
jgi:GNAT superfamily N-acetyltransferase